MEGKKRGSFTAGKRGRVSGLGSNRCGRGVKVGKGVGGLSEGKGQNNVVQQTGEKERAPPCNKRMSVSKGLRA